MVSEVNKIIFNTLVERGGVYIPNVGTLSIYRTPSRKRGSRVVSPSYSVTYTTERRAISLSEVICSIANVGHDVADDIVSRWRKRVTEDNGRVVIEGVGVIANGCYTPDGELMARLNTNHEIIYCSRKGGVPKWILSLLAVLALVTLCFSLYLLLMRNTTVQDDYDVVALENTSSEPLNISDNETDSVVVSKDVIEPIIDSVAVNSADDVVADSTAYPQPLNLSEEAKVESNVEEKIDVDDWRDRSVHHYLIIGSYSTMANANTAVRKAVRRNAEAQCKIIRIGSLYAVAVYGSVDRNECVKFKRNNRAFYKDSWIHTPKKYK